MISERDGDVVGLSFEVAPLAPDRFGVGGETSCDEGVLGGQAVGQRLSAETLLAPCACRPSLSATIRVAAVSMTAGSSTTRSEPDRRQH